MHLAREALKLVLEATPLTADAVQPLLAVLDLSADGVFARFLRYDASGGDQQRSQYRSRTAQDQVPSVGYW